MAAHHVNVEGTLNLLEFAARETESHGRPVVFVYPSSIAAYGLPDLETRRRAGRVREDDWNKPITMYGCNKLYCEHLGRYYAQTLQATARSTAAARRLPVRPVSGTDFGHDRAVWRDIRLRPEMIHAAARGEPYALFRPAGFAHSVHGDARRDRGAAEALGGASRAGCRALLTTCERSIRRPTRFARRSCGRFRTRQITYHVDAKRQSIVDSWPEDVDDTAARRDWDFSPRYDFDRAFHEYLIPTIRQNGTRRHTTMIAIAIAKPGGRKSCSRSRSLIAAPGRARY